ncbi:hypothetical protein ACQ27_gp082 [Klebsiella phage K64-1]|nr:hypothetical protein ACQ27_gp082 [Klebsiella phage K64-1]
MNIKHYKSGLLKLVLMETLMPRKIYNFN